FRRIRQYLLSENKFRKYLVYAIGEIVLVVIGILIALEVNNWNERRNMEKIEIEYLKRLRSDLANDTAYYHRRIKYSEKVIQDHKRAVAATYDEISNPTEFYQSFDYIRFSSEALSIRDNTYREMHNAGQINLIKNGKVKTELLEFYRQVDVAAKHFTEVNDTSIEFLIDFCNQSKALKHFWPHDGTYDWNPYTEEMLNESNDWQWINDPDSESFKSFQFVLGFYSMKQNMFKEYFKDLTYKATILLKEIESELRNRSVEIPELVIESVFVID
ncbi:MAG: DUF6090 family protein, partial [Flavobacteriaceae bacterium]|nr:DUF6090 family protein [Flavobacteriaceae bacterium]